MKSARDVKFIIYQALYIFVVCVIAIKGANLDLSQVIEDDGKPKVILTPEQMDSLQKIIDKSVIVDTSKFAIVDKNLLKDNAKLQEMVRQTMISSSTFTSNSPVVEQPVVQDKTEVVEQNIEKEEIVIGSIQLYQYHENIVPNQGNNPIVVNGTTIPPHSTGRVILGGESTVIITAGDNKKTVSVKENQKPKISFQRIASMGEETRVTYLQGNIGFRVTVSDDFPEQLDVKFSTGVSVKQTSSNTYDVTLNFFGSKGAFDTYVDNREPPYSVGFMITVADKIAGHKITGQNSFVFGEW